jgi:hypothetical protein
VRSGEVAAAIEERDVRGHHHVPGRDSAAILQAHLAGISVRDPHGTRALEDLGARLPRRLGQAPEVLDGMELGLVAEAHGARHLPRQVGVGGELHVQPGLVRRRGLGLDVLHVPRGRRPDEGRLAPQVALDPESPRQLDDLSHPGLVGLRVGSGGLGAVTAGDLRQREPVLRGDLRGRVSGHPVTDLSGLDQADAHALLRQQIRRGDAGDPGAEDGDVEPCVEL